jgi:hypothetical protein
MRPTDRLTPLEEQVALLAAYMLSSSRALLHEPPEYGGFRLVDGARRVMQLLETDGVCNPHFVTICQRMDLLFRSPPGTVDLPTMLDELCLHMAHILKAHTLIAPPPDLF